MLLNFLLKALYIAFLNTVDYNQEFGCQDDLKVFLEFIKSKEGLMNKTVTINRKSLKASWIPLLYFEPIIRKKLIKLVRNICNDLKSVLTMASYAC